MASKSFNEFAFFENCGILGWSIMLFADWLIPRLLLFRIQKNNVFERELTPPNI